VPVPLASGHGWQCLGMDRPIASADYSDQPVTDPQRLQHDGSPRVFRGGSWTNVDPAWVSRRLPQQARPWLPHPHPGLPAALARPRTSDDQRGLSPGSSDFIAARSSSWMSFGLTLSHHRAQGVLFAARSAALTLIFSRPGAKHLPSRAAFLAHHFEHRPAGGTEAAAAALPHRRGTVIR